VGLNFNRNEPEVGKPSQTLGGRIREIFGRRFSLTQYASYSGGQTAFNFGGDFTSTRLSVSVSHAVTYAPFRPVSAGGPFVNVYNVSLHIRLSQQLELNGQSNVAPDGRVRYTTSVSNYLYRYAGLMQGEQPLPSSIGKYVVKGVVMDEQERPIAGAAIRVGNEIAFTDSEGQFVVRLAKRSRESLRVAFEDFLTPTIYELVSAPAQVEATPEQDAKNVIVILRRVTEREKFQQIRSELLAKHQSSPASPAAEAPQSAASALDDHSNSSSRSTGSVGGGGELPQH
jgi:hypothetical protein